MRKAVTLAISVSLMLIICFSMFSIVGATTTTKTFFLTQGQGVDYSVNLQVGQQVTGNFVIVGERIHTWENFYFKILDPNSVTFENSEPSSIDTPYNFSFKAFTSGIHVFKFENSGVNDRYVELSYTVDSGNLPVVSTPSVTNPPDPTPTPTVPEFQPWIVLFAIVTATLLTAIIIRKKKITLSTFG